MAIERNHPQHPQQKLPKFMKSPLKKNNFQKTPATQQKNKRSPVTVLLDFFVHLPQLGVIPNSPAPRLEGTTWSEKGECCWLANPKHVFTRENKKGVDEFRFQESKHKEKQTWLFQEINESRWRLNRPVWKKQHAHKNGFEASAKY